MAKSREYIEQKWATNAEAGSPNWHGDTEAYCRGLEPYGLPFNQCMSNIGASYNAGVTNPGAKEAQASGVRQAAQQQTWVKNWLRGITKSRGGMRM